MSATNPDSPDSEMDLPLSSNIADVKIKHFVLDLQCNMEARNLHGSMILFCLFPDLCHDPLSQPNQTSDLKSSGVDVPSVNDANSTSSFSAIYRESVIILDCFGLSVASVEQVSPGPELESIISRESHRHGNNKADPDLVNYIRNDLPIHPNDKVNIDLESHIGNDSSVRSSYTVDPKLEKCITSDSQIHSREVYLDLDNFVKIYSSNQPSDETNTNLENLRREPQRHPNDEVDPRIENQVKSDSLKHPIDEDGAHLENQISSDTRTSDNRIESQKCLRACDEDMFRQFSKLPGHQVNFDMSKHCVKICGLLPTQRGGCVIRINYNTLPEGPSLMWTLDQDGKPCVFTIGHWLNNRSWFPSQDAPTVLTTWEARITVEKECTVLMSGDRNPDISTRLPGEHTFYYYTTMPMPTSTLALAVGYWKQMNISDGSPTSLHKSFLCASHGDSCQTNYSDKQVLPCCLFASASLMTVAMTDLEHYVPACLKQVYQLLGHHPFQRLDILIVPSCFDSLGLTSPSLLFLAQSVLVGDQSMCVRVAHELCHLWFGLLIGPKDWTEEWLTEGFCTYLEDILHARVMDWEKEKLAGYLSLRCLLKERILKAEVQNTDERVQTLRPNKGEELVPSVGNSSVLYVKNGMNPDKGFMQVHYLKGFFLLKFLERAVGLERFLVFLKEFVTRFHGELVTSQDFFDLLFSSCPELSIQGVTKEQLFEDWLDCPGIPKSLKNILSEKDNIQLREVRNQVIEIKKSCLRYKQSKRSKKKKKYSLDGSLHFQNLHPDQLVVLLDLLLDEDTIPDPVLEALRTNYSLHSANAEIRHRWCELVVRERAFSYYDDVRCFLVQNQALGVYLYGEMMISRCAKQKCIAVECFHLLKRDMPEGVLKTVRSMLYGD